MKWVQKNFWFKLRMLTCGLIATCGFYMLFRYGMDSGGKVLLLIAAIGVATSYLQLFLKERLLHRKA